MSKPTVADTKPTPVELKAGEEYYYCTCGKSASQPFCDGSHKGTDFSPQAFEAEEDGTAYLCQCKQTGNVPFCDGNHKKVPSQEKGREFQLESSGSDPDAMPEAEPTPEEPTVALIHQLASEGLSKLGLMQVMARACGHDHLSQFAKDDLASWDKSLAELAGIEWSGFDPNR